MTITTVFDPPVPSDAPATFNTKAFNTLGDLNTWSDEANALAASLNGADTAAAASASAAASSATSAAGSATTATTQATAASGSATAAASSATAASGSATAAAGSASTASTQATAASGSAAAAQTYASLAQATNPDSPIRLNPRRIAANFTVPTGYNAASTGPITVADGVAVTVATGAAWSVH